MKQLSDLIPVFSFGEALVIFVEKDFSQHENPTAILFDLEQKTFHIKGVHNFLKFSPYRDVDFQDEDVCTYYRLLVQRKMADEMIIEALQQMEPEQEIQEVITKSKYGRDGNN